MGAAGKAFYLTKSKALVNGVFHELLGHWLMLREERSGRSCRPGGSISGSLPTSSSDRCLPEHTDGVGSSFERWIRPKIDRLLARYRAAFCIYELGGYHSPLTLTADFAYVRLHGPGLGKYQESYSKGCLRRWSKQIDDWAKTLSAVYIYFDNDQAGYAARNTLTLKQMVLGEAARKN